MLHSGTVEYLPAYVCGLHTPLPPVFPHSFACTMSAVFLLCLFSTVHRFLSCDTSVQIRCDTDNGILNVMCIAFLSPFFICIKPPIALVMRSLNLFQYTARGGFTHAKAIFRPPDRTGGLFPRLKAAIKTLNHHHK